MKTNHSCPCAYLSKPCSSNCTCANNVKSGGCDFCCSYGSFAQRRRRAKYIAKLIASASEQTEQATPLQPIVSGVPTPFEALLIIAGVPLVITYALVLIATLISECSS